MRIKRSFLIAIAVSFVAVAAWSCSPLDKHPVVDKPPDAAALEIEMVELRGGSFLMGSESDSADERPVHRVAIKPFAIGRYEVLGFQYRAFETATGRSGAKYYGDKAPVSDVSWYDAQAYIDWLNGRTGLNYRLPTEAEWEYAVRAGSTTRYHFGDDEHLLFRYANYGERHSGPLKAGSFRPNAWGIYDMLGNLYEWVEDCWHEDYSGAPSDGRAWVSGCAQADSAVIRGGAWYFNVWPLRSANRDWFNRIHRDLNFGFRLVRDLPAPAPEPREPSDAAALEVEMVELRGGNFLMGSESGSADERPVHRVAIKPFAIGKYEVLGFQYRAFETATGRSGAEYWGDNAAVGNVSWYDAQAYIDWLNNRTGLNYRLPTEAEWEYAARAGSMTKYHFGDDEHLLFRYANYDDSHNGPIKAGSFRPNAWGIYDMLGNVWEWVEDCWHEDYSGAPSDGRAWVSGCDETDSAVVRGGSWGNSAGGLRSANRTWNYRNIRPNGNGFRLVQDL